MAAARIAVIIWLMNLDWIFRENYVPANNFFNSNWKVNFIARRAIFRARNSILGALYGRERDRAPLLERPEFQPMAFLVLSEDE